MNSSISYFVGDTNIASQELYIKQVEALGEQVNEKLYTDLNKFKEKYMLSDDLEQTKQVQVIAPSHLSGNYIYIYIYRTSIYYIVYGGGVIINGITPSDPKGQILERIIDSLGINLVIVLSHELLYNSLSKKYKNKSSPQIIPLSKSAGVVEMSYEMKQNIIGDEFKEYFEGVQGTLRKYRIKLPLHEYKIYKLESGNIYIYIYIIGLTLSETVLPIGESGVNTQRVVAKEINPYTENIQNKILGCVYMSEDELLLLEELQKTEANFLHRIKQVLLNANLSCLLHV